MATNLTANPLTNIWAGTSQNKITINANNREAGIVYKSVIKSNELNGFGYDIYSNVFFNQFTGGYFQQQLTYNQNQFCSILWKQTTNTAYKVVNCICINDNNGAGITNVLPVINGTTQTINGVLVFSGGVENSQYWKLNQAEIFTSFKNTTATITDKTTEQFFKLCDPLSNDNSIANTFKDYKVNGTIFAYKNNNIVAIDFIATAKQFNLSGATQTIGSNVFGVGDWNIDFLDVNFFINSENQGTTTSNNNIFSFNPEYSLNQYKYFMPLGLSIILSNDGLFLSCLGLDKVEIVGNGNVEFNLSSVSTLPDTHYYLPIRNHGGCKVFKDLGKFSWNSFYTFNNNVLLQGLIPMNPTLTSLENIDFNRGLSLFNTPTLSLNYASLVNQIKTFYPNIADHFIRMAGGSDTPIYQTQQDVFHDVFSGSYDSSKDSGNNFLYNNWVDYSAFNYGNTYKNGIWNGYYRYHFWLGSGASGDISMTPTWLSLEGLREYQAQETRPKNISLPLTLQIF